VRRSAGRASGPGCWAVPSICGSGAGRRVPSRSCPSGSPVRVRETAAILTVAVAVVVVPTIVHGWPTSLAGNAAVTLCVAGGAVLVWWRTRPRLAAVAALVAFLLALLIGTDLWVPDGALIPFSAAFALLALSWRGRAAWWVAGAALAYVVVWIVVVGANFVVATLMFTVPPFVAGTVLRLRRETAEQLERKARELEEERELLTELTVRRERVRIAAELHDIVGHAISVMVIQAAAGQRLVDTSPDRARETLVAIAESASQGREDLERLIELLGGHDVVAQDLTLVDEVVERAARSGLDVTYRLEGDADALPASVAHLAFRVVQESLTNALRHAPGAEVRICVRAVGAAADVRVENGVARSTAVPGVSGTGRGLVGLGERIDELGGFVRAGETPGGGWLVEARIGR